MRIATRIKVGSWFMYATIGRVQTVTGVSSKIGPNQHNIYWDFDNSTLDEVIKELTNIQKVFDLGEIYIFSDKEFSYRASCYTVVTLKKLLTILILTVGVDDVFIAKTAQKGQATIRLSKKQGRKNPEIVHVIQGRNEPLPENISVWRYETGTDPRVINLNRFR
jgi:hypothetical protein